ncbi:MAG: hypothetical protein JSR85_06980 [Proteobacteria bacterium]|nr:hypothetical protein [Pseudomonadota bacterium]
MMKDKKIQTLPFWRRPFQWGNSVKKLFVFLTLFIFLLLSLFIIWKRHLEKAALPPEVIVSSPPPAQPASPVAPTPVPQPVPPPPVAPAAAPPSPPLEGLNVLADRLTALESKVNQQLLVQTPQKLITVELFRSTLEGWIPLDNLKTFLQKNPEPWAQGLLAALTPVKECKTYPQLKALLIIPPSQSLSTWDKIKRKIKSLIRIRKLDDQGNYQYGHIEDVQNALKENNIQQALDLFEKLLPEEKGSLSSWKEMAQNRLALEMLMKKFLIELSES